ncbi:RES family NAD+ phosphorylase [Pseudomonas alcaligenes]|uniref:RES family NAD+ phosphorylase n=1 Tax=Pseudomonas sp. RIT-PI-AD TaxID=3035294 RepID=UPI0021DB79F5
MSEIWLACEGEGCIQPLRGRLVRMVESQEQVATSRLVDTLAEQALLEELIETCKPPLPVDSDPGLHYLLKTPFRYPPLRWGSRFGSRQEPSLFYGATRVETAMAEAAYYRFVLWDGMVLPPPGGRLLSEHVSFGARYGVARGVRLQAEPFSAFAEVLTDPCRYSATQALGAAMRAAGVQAFEYRSARQASGVNVALFTPQAFLERKPFNLEPWLCETTADQVAFKLAHFPNQPRSFMREAFMTAGGFPSPAS